eukprot:38911-Chlamydomonas_euryale.AAC.7
MAVPLSFAIFIVAWVLQLVVYFGFPFNSTSGAARAVTVIFAFMPWTLLSKGVLDLSDATTGSWAYGISPSTVFTYCWEGTPPPDVAATQSEYWQADCSMPLGQIFWVLPLQVRREGR